MIPSEIDFALRALDYVSQKAATPHAMAKPGRLTDFHFPESWHRFEPLSLISPKGQDKEEMQQQSDVCVVQEIVQRRRS